MGHPPPQAYDTTHHPEKAYNAPPAAVPLPVNPTTGTQGYPGVVGGTPANQRGFVDVSVNGQPVQPAFMAQRHQVEQSLGPTCPQGGFHELRMHYTKTTLLFSLLIFPYLCGWRGRRECVCKRCGQTFPTIVLPEP